MPRVRKSGACARSSPNGRPSFRSRLRSLSGRRACVDWLGAHLIGTEVTELLPELTLACRLKLPAEAVAHTVHAHPTLSEVVMEAAHGLVGGYIHA